MLLLLLQVLKKYYQNVYINYRCDNQCAILQDYILSASGSVAVLNKKQLADFGVWYSNNKTDQEFFLDTLHQSNQLDQQNHIYSLSTLKCFVLIDAVRRH